MKHIKISMFLCGIFVIMAFSCKKESNTTGLLWELPLNGDKTAIVNQVNDIEFKFCLLNEEGNPSTSFNAQENFIFYFLIKNISQNEISVDGKFINSDFFNVYKNNIQEINKLGKPWSGIFCEYSLSPQVFSLLPNDSLVLKIPWSINSEENGNYYYPFCMAIKNALLQSGIYFSQFTIELPYKKAGKEELISNLSFKLNFEVK